MEKSRLAEHFTLALAGRAKNVAPALAEAVPLQNAETLLEVGGGTGIYSIGFVRKNPKLTATVLDRPEVLKTAESFAQQYDVSDNIKLLPGDMFSGKLPAADVVLLSNILHDWDVPECRELVRRCADALNPGGRLIIHDVLLNDQLDGPLPIALYSAALFTLTEGRAYSAAEYESWMNNAGLATTAPVPTLIHCHAMPGTKS
jgi:predicted O-methyltransferase YrrM